MAISREYSNLIDQYFSGEMTGTDRLVFEGRVASDPILGSEFDHQSDIIENLKGHREMELKARMNSIDVSPTIWASLAQSSMMKPVIYGISSLMVVSASYFYINTEESFETHLEHLQPISEYTELGNLEPVYPNQLDYQYDGNGQILDYYDEILEIEADFIVTDEHQQMQAIDFDVPQVAVAVENNDVHSPDAVFEGAKRIENISSPFNVEKINIETVSSRKYKFHYKMEDNKLFLYGKFNESPYEILEINSTTDKRLFFFYYGDFYRLEKSTRKATPLIKIENRKLINELDVLKSRNR